MDKKLQMVVEAVEEVFKETAADFSDVVKALSIEMDSASGANEAQDKALAEAASQLRHIADRLRRAGL